MIFAGIPINPGGIADVKDLVCVPIKDGAYAWTLRIRRNPPILSPRLIFIGNKWTKPGTAGALAGILPACRKIGILVKQGER